MLGEMKVLLRINTKFRNNGFMKNSIGTLGRGDFYEGRVAVIKDNGFVNSSDTQTSFNAVRKFFVK
jgi:hypothetical protein